MYRQIAKTVRAALRIPATDRTRGASLITVLAFSIVTLVIGANILAAGSGESRNADQRLNSSQAFFLSEAGFQHVAAQAYNDPTWITGGASVGDTLDQGSYSAIVRDTTFVGLPAGSSAYRVISTGTVAGFRATSTRVTDALITVTQTGIDLGTASSGNYTAFTWGATAVTTSGSSKIRGNSPHIGISSGGSLTMGGSSQVVGNAYDYTGAPITTGGSSSGGAIVQGASTNAMLNTAASDAAAASTRYAALPATLGPTSLTTGQTITGILGQNVLNLTSVNLGSSKTVTLNAPIGATFVINVSGTFDIGSSSQVRLTGGVTAADILWNVSGVGTVTLSGSSEFNGILLAPQRTVVLSGASNWTGAVLCGGGLLDLNGSTDIIGCGASTTGAYRKGSVTMVKWSDVRSP